MKAKSFTSTNFGKFPNGMDSLIDLFDVFSKHVTTKFKLRHSFGYGVGDTLTSTVYKLTSSTNIVFWLKPSMETVI